MSTQHTPGPWEAVSNLVRTQRDRDGSGGFLVAECPAGVGSRIEDARLIAAAPDMYEALKTAPLTPHTFRDPQARCSCSQCQFVRAARAALAKAEDKS